MVHYPRPLTHLEYYDDDILTVSLTDLNNTIRYETTRRSVNVRSEADMSQLNLPHGNDN